MSQLPNVNSAFTGAANDSLSSANALNEVNVDDFLKLMIAELQNQDPLNPLENDELVAQMSQIRSVAATDKLTQTLDSVLLGQNIASATNLIGADIDGISDDGQKVTGIVQRVSVASGRPKLHLDLNPRAAASFEAGSMEEGEYQYRVVWEDQGKLFAVDPLAKANGDSGSIKIQGREGVDQSVLISNLPQTRATRRVYRREAGDDDFELVGTITDTKAATFLDTKAKDEATIALTGTPIMLRSQREFEVSLNNVGEIRPQARTTTTP
jgi:flagellar basal-body rod modification protein FlgD